MNNYECLSDEVLLLSARMGDLEAEMTLLNRYKFKAEAHIRTVLPSSYFRLSEWDRASLCFSSYCRAYETYQFTSRRRFKTYYRVVLHNEAATFLNGEMRKPRMVSLDSPASRDGETTYHEMVGECDEPIYEATPLPKPRRVNPAMLLIASLKLDGWTFERIGDYFEMSIKQVRDRFLSLSSMYQKLVPSH